MVSIPAAGQADDDITPKWYVFHVDMNDTTGDRTSVSFRVNWTGPAALYVSQFLEGTFRGSGWCAYSGTGVHLGTSVGATDVEWDPVGGDFPPSRCGFVVQPVGLQEFVVLAVGDILTMDVVLVGQGTIDHVAEGPAHERTGHDLEGAAYADANVIDATARASIMRTLDFNIEGHLFGWFLTPLGFPSMGLSIPTVSSESTTDHSGLNTVESEPVDIETWGCRFPQFTGPAARGAGNTASNGPGRTYRTATRRSWRGRTSPTPSLRAREELRGGLERAQPRLRLREFGLPSLSGTGRAQDARAAAARHFVLALALAIALALVRSVALSAKPSFARS